MSNTEKTVKDIRRKARRKARRKCSTEEKIRIVLDGFRGESSVAELCRREGINLDLYYRWTKDFLETGKKRQIRTADTWIFNPMLELCGYFLVGISNDRVTNWIVGIWRRLYI